MSQISFIEVLGGALVATSSVTTIEVSETERDGFAVLIHTTMGNIFPFSLCEEEDEAFAKMHALAEAIGPVYSEQ